MAHHSETAIGLKFMYERKLIHRDIKPQNLLLTSHNDDAILKIADFGFARQLTSTSLAETLCGSPLYMAPEILQHQPYDAKADLWSVGTVLYEMVSPLSSHTPDTILNSYSRSLESHPSTGQTISNFYRTSSATPYGSQRMSPFQIPASSFSR